MIKLKDTTKDKFVQSLLVTASPGSVSTIELSDGPMQIPTRKLIINILLWRIYFKFNLPIYKSDIFDLDNINKNFLSKIHSKMYDRIIDVYPEKQSEIITLIWENINMFQYFFLNNFAKYHCSVSIIELANIVKSPALKGIVDIKIDNAEGTKIAEKRIKMAGAKLIDKLKEPDSINNNILHDYIRVGVLKENQIPQMMIAYGCRDDIDGTMAKHIIGESAISGLKSVHDFIVEALSAKKAGYYNKELVPRAQYFARRIHLTMLPLKTLYKGDCGTKRTIRYNVMELDRGNLDGKIIILDDGTEVVLNSDNFDIYLNQTVNMRSPTVCNYTDGCCEKCGGTITKYIISDVNLHLGLFCGTKVVGPTTQIVLSTKHLIKTDTKEYRVPSDASRYLIKKNTSIHWRPNFADRLEDVFLKIPINNIDPLDDLRQEIPPISESFSRIDCFELWDSNEDFIDEVQLAEDKFIPYFSDEMLTHMTNNFRKLTVDAGVISIPLNNFNPKWQVFNYTVINDDMVSFVNNVDTFLKQITTHHTIQGALRELTALLYSKTSINLFYVEMLLKAFMVTDDANYRIPVVEDQDKVKFSTMAGTIENRSVSVKLGFEKIKEYLCEPKTFTEDKDTSDFDIYFGF